MHIAECSLLQGRLHILINICIVDTRETMVWEATLFPEKMGQHLTECMDYRQIKKVIIPIDCTIRSHCLEKVEMLQSSTAYTFIHLFVHKSQITKK